MIHAEQLVFQVSLYRTKHGLIAFWGRRREGRGRLDSNLVSIERKKVKQNGFVWKFIGIKKIAWSGWQLFSRINKFFFFLVTILASNDLDAIFSRNNADLSDLNGNTEIEVNLSNAAYFKIYFQMMFQMHVFLNTINRIDIFPYLNIFFGEFFFDTEIFHHFQSKLRSQKNKRKKK